MRKLGMFCTAALLVGLLSLPANAEVQNVEVSGDITVRGIYRTNYDLTKENLDATTAKDDKSFYMSTVRVRLDADLTDNVAATIRFINERDWDADTASSDDIDLDLAYITLKEVNYWPVTLTLGRQELRYGNLLIIGDGDVNSNVVGGITAKDLSSRKAFDAIKAVFDLSPLTLDIFTAKIDEDTSAGTTSDTDLYGINARYQFAEYDAVGEAYYFCKKTGGTDHSRVDTVGVRTNITPIENLTLNAEYAHQFGEYDGSRNRSANAVQLGVDYDMPDYQYSPSIGLWYTYLSGQQTDPNGTLGYKNTGTYEGWDAMYGDQVPGEIMYALGFAATNVHIINAKASAKPTDKLTASLNYYHFNAAEKYYAANWIATGADFTSRTYALENDSDLGDEFDLKLTYDYTEDVQFGLLVAYFIPGTAFADSNDDTAKEVIGSVSVVF